MPTSPNIVLVITHDTGRHLGLYGRGVETPNLDRVAQQGIVFEQAFCAAPQCSPSRASMLTGLAPSQHGLIGLVNLGFRLAEKSSGRVLPTLLNQAGYHTELFGIQHEAPHPGNLGYQNHFLAAGRQTCRLVTPEVAKFLTGPPREPFFAMVGFFETHRPFEDTDIPLDAVRVPSYLPDDPIVRRDVANLNEQVRRVDAAVGQIVDALDRSGLADRTLFIYTTDHGIAFPGAKATLFDPGLEIGLIMRGPRGFTGGRRIPALVSNVDVLPTILEFAGVDPPPGLQGTSVQPLVRGDLPAIHDAVFAGLTYHVAYDPVRGVRTNRHKYIRSFADRAYAVPSNVDGSPTKELLRDQGYFERRRPRELLFDLIADPLEQTNLTADPSSAGILADMRARLDRWLEETCDPIRTGDIPLPAGAQTVSPDAYSLRS